MTSSQPNPANRAAFFLSADNPTLSITTAPIVAPGPSQVSIRNHACAINPTDAFMRQTGMLITHWPHILGCDSSGVIEAVGANVSHVKPGDRVFAACAGEFKGTGFGDTTGFGGLQYYTLADANVVGKIPDRVGFAEAAVFPLTAHTSALALFGRGFLGLRRPEAVVSEKDRGEEYVLVWGGSSSVGMSAIQLARCAGYRVVTTCSKENQRVCEEVGAEKAFDHKSAGVEDEIVQYLNGKTLIGSVDAVSRYGTPERIVKVVQAIAGGSKKIAFVVPGAENGHPEDIQVSSVLGVPDAEAEALIKYIFTDFLPAALETGAFKAGRPKPEIVGHGLEFAEEALDKMAEGVSASKLVVTL